MRSRAIVTLILSLASLISLPGFAHAGEVLAESGPARVVSGDKAVWLTRGLTVTPEPSKLSVEIVSRLVDSVSTELDQSCLAALAEGISRFGWAQLETEPVGVAEPLKVRSYATAESLVVRKMDLHDRVEARASMDLETGAMSIERFELERFNGPTVYDGLVSPEFWIVQQEHMQKQFFESIMDLDHPGLERVRDAYDSGKISLALYEVAEYYRRKAESTGMARSPAQHPTTSIDPRSEQIVNHTFDGSDFTVQMGPRIDWQTHPAEAHGPEWLWGVNRHFQWLALLGGYAETANEKYAEEYVNQICDFIISNPAPPYSLTRVPSWRNLEVGIRAAISWPQSFYGFLSSPSFTPQAIQLALTGMWSHGNYIYDHPAGLRRPSNWSIVDSSGLSGIALYFPEFAESNTWRDASYERLTFQLHLQVYSDGAQYELATDYHEMCLGRFQSAMDLAERTGNELPEEFGGIVESMYEYLMWLAKPDGARPALGDAGPTSLRSTLSAGARRFKRDDMLYVGTGGQEGTPPSGTSHLSPDAGYAVMRSDWGPDARYLLFDGGPVGSGHQHEDKLSILLSAFGADFLVDPGPFEYVGGKWRQHAISTAAHSTAIVDGYGQNRIETGIEHYASETPTPQWESTEDRDYMVARYDAGYGPDSIAVTHRRHVLFQKPDYWVVVDEFHGQGDHTMETLFQFAPDIDVTHADGSVVAVSPDGPSLIIQPADAGNTAVDVVAGQEEPRVLGWYMPHDRVPAPVAVFRNESALPLVQAYLLYPMRSADEDVPSVTATREGDTLVVSVTAAGDTERIRFELETDR